MFSSSVSYSAVNDSLKSKEFLYFKCFMLFFVFDAVKNFPVFLWFFAL